MNGDPIKQALRDFVATSNSGKYKTEDELMSKFPELAAYDRAALRDFVATSNSGKYKSEDELFEKFPEFGGGLKKKELSDGGGPAPSSTSLAKLVGRATQGLSVVNPKGSVSLGIKTQGVGSVAGSQSISKSESESDGEATNIEDKPITEEEFLALESQAKNAYYDITSGRTKTNIPRQEFDKLIKADAFKDKDYETYKKEADERNKKIENEIQKIYSEYGVKETNKELSATQIADKIINIADDKTTSPIEQRIKNIADNDKDFVAEFEKIKKEISEYAKTAKTQKELDLFVNQKNKNIQELYQKSQERAIELINNELNKRVEEVIRKNTPGVDLIEKSGVKNKLDELTGSVYFDKLPYDRKKTLLNSMYVTIGNELAKKGMGDAETLLNLRNQLDANYLDKFYITKKGEVSSFTTPPKEYSLGEQYYDALARGSSRLGKYLAETPAFIYDIFALPQNIIAKYTGLPIATSSQDFSQTVGLPENQVANYYEDAIKETQNKIDAKYDKGIVEYFLNGEIENGLELLSTQILESAPITISLMMGNYAGITPMQSVMGSGIVFAAGEKAELDANPELANMSETNKMTNALVKGFSEGVFEQAGLTKLGNGIKQLIKGKTREEVIDIGKKSFVEVYGPIVRKYGGVAFEEGLSEAATTFSQNFADKYMGIDPNKKLDEGLADSFVVGIASGAGYSAAPTLYEVAITKQNREKGAKLEEKKQAIAQDMSRVGVGVATQKVLAEQLKNIQQEEAEAYADEKAKVDALPEESKTEVLNLRTKLTELSDGIADPTISEESRKALESEFDKVQGQVDELINTPPVAPKAEVVSAPTVASPTQEGQVLPLQEGVESQAMGVPEVSGEATQTNPVLANVESTAKADYLVDSIFIEKINPDGENTPLTERQQGSIDKAIQMAIDAGQTAEQIAGTLNGLGYAFRNPSAMLAAQQTLINYIKNRIKGTDTRNVNEFAKDTKAVESLLSKEQTLENLSSPEAVTQVGEATQTNPVLADVKSTREALDMLLNNIIEKNNGDRTDFSKAISKIEGVINYTKEEYKRRVKALTQSDVNELISEKYHKAKKDGSNPELVAAVEESLSKEQEPQIPQQDDTENKPGMGGDAVLPGAKTESGTEAVEAVPEVGGEASKTAPAEKVASPKTEQPIVEIGEEIKPKKGKVYRAISSSDNAVGEDVSYSSNMNWYEGDGFLIEANESVGVDIGHNEGKRGKISNVETIYYEPKAFSNENYFKKELDKLKAQFPNANFVEMETIEDESGNFRRYEVRSKPISAKEGGQLTEKVASPKVRETRFQKARRAELEKRREKQRKEEEATAKKNEILTLKEKYNRLPKKMRTEGVGISLMEKLQKTAKEGGYEVSLIGGGDVAIQKDGKVVRRDAVKTEAEEKAAKAEQKKKETEVKNKIPVSAYEAVVQYFANGGKINTDEFITETGFSKERARTELAKRKGMLSSDAISLDKIAMDLAEKMAVGEETYTETQAEISDELKNALKDFENRGQALDELLYINRELQQETKEQEQERLKYEARKKGELPIEEEYTEEELAQMAKDQEAASAESVKEAISEAEKLGMVPKKEKRTEILSEIEKIKEEIRKMSQGRLSSLPVDVFAKYVQLAAKYIELGVVDAKEFLAEMKKSFGKMSEEVEADILAAHDKAMADRKTSKFAGTVSNATTGISGDTKTKFEREGAKYTPKTIKETAQTAGAAWGEIVDRNNGDMEAAVNEGYDIVMNYEWGANPEQVGILAAIVAKEMNNLRSQPGLTIEQIQDYDTRAAEVFSKVRQRLTAAGQETAIVGKFMQEYFMSYPEGMVQFVYTAIDGQNESIIGTPGAGFTGTLVEIVNQIASTEAGKEAINAYATKRGRTKRKYTEKQKAVSDYFDNLIAEFDNSTKGVAFAVPIPPSVVKAALKVLKKGIISGLNIAQAVELAVNKVSEEMGGVDFDKDKARAWFTQTTKDAEKYSTIQTDPNALMEQMQEKLAAEAEAKKQRAKEALEKFNAKKAERAAKDAEQKRKTDEKKAITEAEKEERKKLRAEERKALRAASNTRREQNQFEENLKKLKGEKLKAFVYKIALNFANGKGSLTSDDINRAFQQAMGGVQLSGNQHAKLHGLAQTLINAMKLTQTAGSTSNPAFVQSWIQAQYQANKAATLIKEMMSSRVWVDMVKSNMVMGFMTVKTLGANPISNAIHKLYKGLYEDTLFSFVDVLYAPGDKSTFAERFFRLFNIKPTKEYIKTLPVAARHAFNVMWDGSPIKGDIDKYGGSHQMRPIDAWTRMREEYVKAPTFIAKMNSIAKNTFEGTTGIPTAIVSRTLSAGDMFFTVPEFAKLAQKWADDMGVPIDTFLTDPEYQEYVYYAERYSKYITFQQENIVTQFLGKSIPNMQAREWKKWAETLGITPVRPFFGTPVNIKHEMLTMLPFVSFPEAVFHGTLANDTRLSEARRMFHKKLSQQMMRRAIGSVPLYAAASVLLATGFISFIGGGGDDTPEERANRLKFEGRPGGLKIKGRDEAVDGLKFGPFFDYLMTVDKINRTYDEKDGNIGAAVLIGMSTTLKSTIDNTYLQGLKNVVEALSQPERKLENLLINTYGSAYANILFPSVMSQITQYQDNEKVLRLMNDESFMTKLYNNVIRKRLGFLPGEEFDIEKLPAKYNVLGEPIRTDFEGKPDLWHYFFDFTRAQVYAPEKSKYVYAFKKYKETGDSEWLFDIPPYTHKVDGTSFKLTPQLWNEYQRMIGENAREEYDKYWKTAQKDSKIKQNEMSLVKFNSIKKIAKERAKTEFEETYKTELERLKLEKIEAEKIVKSQKLFLE